MAGAEGGAIRIGVGGWTYAPWRGGFYPARHPQKDELAYASRRLTSIEIELHLILGNVHELAGHRVNAVQVDNGLREIDFLLLDGGVAVAGSVGGDHECADYAAVELVGQLFGRRPPRRHPRRWRRFFCGRETFSEGIASI